MIVVGVDPGTTKSAVVVWDGEKIQHAKIYENQELVDTMISTTLLGPAGNHLAIEWIQSYGMSVGKEVFETCRWCGRFEQAWPGNGSYLTRKQIKIHLCESLKATDSNIRQALIDRFGEPGKKSEPGLTYGLKKDLWSAFAIAVTQFDKMAGKSSAF